MSPRSCVLLLVVVVALICTVQVGAQGTTVMGVDLGTEFIKVCASTRANTIDIVLNEQTRRKSNNYLGFRGDDRWFGEDARNLAARFPANMFSAVSRLIGLGYDNPEDQVHVAHYKDILQLPYKIGNSTRGGLTLSTTTNPEVTYTVEELMAMMWTHLKDITLKDREITDRNQQVDCAVTVPAFWNLRMRQAMVDSASIAGVRVTSQLHPTTATALQFGMQHQGFGNETKNVIIFDMGTAKTEVGVFTFTEPELGEGDKRVKLAHSMGTMTTKFIGSDPTLGGRNWDLCIAEELQRQAVAKWPKMVKPLNGTTNAQMKSVFTLMRAANQLKETMSANAANAPVTVEGIAPDRDFNSKMKREDFEVLCAPLFTRALDLVKTAVKESGLTMEDINRFELMGGGSRIPKLIDDLSALYGKPVDRTLNTDEAAAWGAAYYAARLTGFRVRSFKVVEKVAVNLDVVLSGRKDAVDSEDAKKPVARAFLTDVIPGSSKSLTVSRNDDFTMYLQDKDTKKTFATVEVTGLGSALELMSAFKPPVEHENNTHITRVELKFGDNYLLTATEAQVKVALVHNVSKRIKVEVNETEADNETATPAEGAEDTAAAGEEAVEETKTEEAPVATEGGDAPTDANATDANGTDTNTTKKAKKPKKVWTNQYRLELKRNSRNLIVKIQFHDTPAPMSSDDLAAAKATLAGLEALDEAKRLVSQAKNDLETYLHHVKSDGILDNAEILEMKLMDDTQKAAIEEAAATITEWVEDGEGSYDSATAQMFVEKHEELKKVTAPVEEPHLEHKKLQAEILHNATEAKKKEKEDAKKKEKQEMRAEQRAKEEAEKAAKKAAEEAAKDKEGEATKEGTEGEDGEEAPKDPRDEEPKEEEPKKDDL